MTPAETRKGGPEHSDYKVHVAIADHQRVILHHLDRNLSQGHS